MKKKLPSFLAGFLAAVLLVAIPAAYAANAWTKTIEVGSINILVNGKEFHPTDPNGNPVDVFVYNGTTYAPLRALAEAYGLTVGYDAAKNMATVTSSQSQIPPADTGSPSKVTTITYSKFPEILSFENVSPNTPVSNEFDISHPQWGLNVYDYVYKMESLSQAENMAKTYAYWLREQGYTLIREEDDPVVKQSVGSDIVYELRDPSNAYIVSVKGGLTSAPSNFDVTVGIDYTSQVSSGQTKPNSPTTLISEPLSTFDYGVNFLNGVKLSWLARNQTGKTINYVKVRLNFYNGVGDPAYDEITGLPYTNITLVGPVEPDGLIAIHGIVGYIPACAKIQIGNIELEYSDRTKDSFWYGYYTTKRNHNLDS